MTGTVIPGSFAVIPGLTGNPAAYLPPVLHPRQRPAAGDDGVGLEQLQRSAGPHLGGDDAEEVVLKPYTIDSHHVVSLGNELEGAGELLVLPPLPVEIYAYGNLAYDE